MIYLSIDLETTGLDPRSCQTIEIAAVLEDTNADPLPEIEDLPYFHTYVKYPVICGEPYALKMNREIIDRVHDAGGSYPDSGAAWQLFIDWMFAQNISRVKRVNVAGKNVANFDLRFMPADVRSMFQHRCIDPGSMFVDWKAERLPGLKDLLDREPAHTAYEDACDVIRVLRRTYPET